MSNLKISLLGKPIVEFKGSSVKFRRRKTIALLAYLALNPGTHHRDSLIALLWPDSNQQKGRHGLRQLIWDFTAITEKPMLIMDDDSLGLSESQNIWVDTRLFFELTGGIQFRVDERNPKLPDDLVQAIVLVKGDFLSGFALSRIPEFEDWQVIQSEKIRQRLADTLEWLTGFFQETQDFKQALQYAQRWSAMDLLDEKSQRAQIRLLAFNNQRSLAIKHYNKLIQSLESELGVEPEEETLSLFQAISNNTLQIGSVHSLKPQLFSDTSQRSLKPFFGRHKELAKISALLEGKKCRLLTLIGPGGVGKTSLAMEVLRKIKPAFCDGLFYISLVTIESDQALILAIGSTVGMAVNEVIDPKSGLLSYLKDKNLLLILDHFEQLTACSHSIADIVDAAPKVKILVTSRERLRLQQEWLLNIEGLPVKSPGNIGLSEAAELFFQTAIRVNPEFNLKQELNDMTTICQQVEGLPLAIELAASWTRTLSCNEIHQEIEESLDFLTSSNINIAAQHRSIRAVFDASWERLSEKHKQILKNLSIFEDSMSTDACQSVAKASIADLLELQDNSVLSRTKAGLFRLHDLIRQFSSEKRNKDFAESGQLDDRFVKYYAYFAQHQLQLLKGKDQEQSISKIKETFSNLIKALHLALSKPQWDSFGEIFSVLLLYFEMSNQYKDGILELQ
ncbi:hypothetical protein KKA14_01720, partial [bacterium]|nr:hypothetical protein [bacterium]